MIEIINLSKCYGDKQAVKGMTFTLEEGKIYGFLGPNGAGKSTTMNMMTGCLAMSDGDIVVDGISIYDKPIKVKEKFGYLPEIPPLYNEMTPKEYLTFVAGAKRVNKHEIASEVGRVMACTSVNGVKDRLIRNLSKGYMQRIGIAAALIGSPKYIILDEPTVGLDPTQIIEIRNLIMSLKDEHTVILSSHILSEVSAVCDEILVISNGELIAFDTPQNLQNMFGNNKILKLGVRTEQPDTVAELLKRIENIISVSKPTAADDGYLYEVSMGEADLRDEIFFTLADARTPIISMELQKHSLEEIFIELTAGDDENTEYVVKEDNENDIAI